MMEKKFVLERVQGAHVSTEELLADLCRVGSLLEVGVVSQRIYAEHGKYHATTVARRFGSWNKAIAAAGLNAANIINYPDAVLFENMMRLWEHYGRQPRQSELALPPSEISGGPYKRRFRTWQAALESFVTYANAEDAQIVAGGVNEAVRRGSRDPSLRLRFRVLKRDDFKCRACGGSPATKPGLNLHVDHIVPWSVGGETIEDNLQALCELCNLGKSNVL